MTTRSRSFSSVSPLVPTLLCCVLLACTVFAAPADAARDRDKGINFTKEQEARIAELAPEYREWLESVEVLISEDEVDAFLELEQDYQRDAFIDRFWRVRDSYADTATNEFRERYEQRVQSARQLFGTIDSEPAQLYLLNGEPVARLEDIRCSLLNDLMIWYYDGSDQVFFEFFFVFYREFNAGPWRLWRPSDGPDRILNTFNAGSRLPRGASLGEALRDIQLSCREGDFIVTALAWVQSQGLDYGALLARMSDRPESGESEWVATFNSYSTDVPQDATALPAELELEYPGHRQARTLVQGLLTVPRDEAVRAELGDHRSYNFVLNGEVIRDGELFDNFRYKFDLPASQAAGETIPLVFERYLRPGDYRLVLKLEDVNGKAFYRDDRTISVPRVDRATPPPPPDDPLSARLLEEANRAITTGETTLELVEPISEILTGYVRFDTLTTGPDIDKVEFALDGRPILVKKRAPYSVELDMGTVPRSKSLSATAYDASGEEIARDEILINAGGSRFSIDLIEPRKNVQYTGSLRAEANVEVPEGKAVERVEFFLNETRVATLYQEPWTQAIVLPQDEYLAYVRAVAYMPDGNFTEDLVFVNAPDYQEEVDIQFVELYAAVLDKQGRPIEGLTQDAFTPIENGEPQEIARFEVVDNLPIHAGVLLDVSASMEGSMDSTQQAALQFFEQTIRPKDRAALMTFNDRPNLKVQFTNDTTELAGGLAGLKPERGTALYDSIIFSLYYFNGVKGQRALLILSDGKDESSKYTYEQALDYARRTGVTIYSIALRDDQAHKKLSKITDQTGGRSFFVEDPAELPGVYETIQEELRSRYLVAYQSSNVTESKEFRTVELEVDRPGAEAKTIRGYYP